MATLLPGCNRSTAYAGEVVRLYQCPDDAQALVQGVLAFNRSGGDGTFRLWLVRGGDERFRDDGDLLARDESLSNGERLRVRLGLGLQPGDTLVASASVPGFNFQPAIQEVR